MPAFTAVLKYRRISQLFCRENEIQLKSPDNHFNQNILGLLIRKEKNQLFCFDSLRNKNWHDRCNVIRARRPNVNVHKFCDNLLVICTNSNIKIEFSWRNSSFRP